MASKAGIGGRKSRFSQAEKEKILREHIGNGTPISQLARENGIQAVTIYQWKRNIEMTESDDDAITPQKIRELLAEIATLKNENKQLKIKVADLAVGNDILTDALEIQKKRDLSRQLRSLEKSKKPKGTK